MQSPITEQHGIDQPTGIRQALDLLSAKFNSRHEAQHVAMGGLGQMVGVPNAVASRRMARPISKT